MLYLSYVWQIISDNYGIVAVSLGNMLVLFCFLRPRLKWWFYPSLVVLNYLTLPLIYELGIILFGEDSNVLLAFLGYFSDILVLIGFKESFWKKITLIFTMCVLNRMFTFWGYILHVPLNILFGGKWDIQTSVTFVIGFMYILISLVCWLTLKNKGRKLIQTGLRQHNWVVLGQHIGFRQADYRFLL